MAAGDAGPAAAGGPEVKIKSEKPDDPDEPKQVAGEPLTQRSMKVEDGPSASVKEEVRIKSEKVDIKDTVKGEDGVKAEGQVKNERSIKAEKLDKDEKAEAFKHEAKSDVKRDSKNEGAKGESKSEQAKGEKTKGETKSEVKGETKGEVKGEIKGEPGVKRERPRSPGKKDKKIKKEQKDEDKKEKKRAKKEAKAAKKRGRSRSGDAGPRKRKSKWGPDTGGFSLTAIPAGRGGNNMLPSATVEDQMPRFTDEELLQRVLVLENLSLSVTGQELIEFFNGAVLAVTANAVQQAGNKAVAPVFACTVTEEDRGGDDKRKTAELKFRTEDGASVGMKLMGIEYKGKKVSIRRPDDFVKPDDGLDPSTKLNLNDVSMARLVGERAASGQAEFSGPIPKLSIFNLPDSMNEQIVRDLLSQFGRLRMLSLIRDLATGKIKGYGIFEYENPNDVDLAVIALNGFVCGQSVIRVQKLGGQTAQAAPKAQPVAATAMSNSMTQKIVQNPVLAMQVKQGREVGSRPTTIVQLLNAVYQEDLMDDEDYEDITTEIHTEASKHGAVQRVVIPKPAKDGSFVDGVGKIFVSFVDLTAARKFQMDCNGRKFENRVVCAAFYPIDKFTEGRYKLWST